MTELPLWRLHALRACYLIMAVGLGVFVWPVVISHLAAPLLGGATANSLLAGIGALSILGLFHPLRMLPLLLFEVTWKAIFLAFYALPLWRSGSVDEASLANIQAVLVVVIFLPLIPWRHVWATYLASPAERWR